MTKENQTYGVVVGLDIGTSKICAVISRLDEQGQPEVLGVANVPSRGIRKGVVVNLEQVALVTTAAIEKAELQAGLTVDSVILGISGGHIESTKSKGIIAISSHKEIDQTDVQRVIEAATTIVIPPDREIIHTLPQSYTVDDEVGIKDPIGMAGSRLEVQVNIITVAASSINNLIKSVYKAGFNTADIVLKSLATSRAVLKEEEKEEGCILVDIGSGTTNFMIYSENGIKHTGQLSIGGAHITNDISYGMKTTAHIAEQIKCDFGAAIADMVPLQAQIEILSPNGKTERVESRRLIAEIIQPRLEEILFLVNEEIEKTGLKPHLSAGIILTGGVASTEFIENLAEEIFQLPVRIGVPSKLRGLNEFINNPFYATATGLALYGLQYSQQNSPQKVVNKLGPMGSPDEDKNFQTIVSRIQGWFNEFF